MSRSADLAHRWTQGIPRLSVGSGQLPDDRGLKNLCRSETRCPWSGGVADGDVERLAQGGGHA